MIALPFLLALGLLAAEQQTFSLWEQYPRMVMGIATAGLLAAVVIVILLVERHRRQRNLIAWRRAEKEARATESLIRGVFALWPQPVAVVSPQGVVIRVNAGWSEGRRLRSGPFEDVEVGTNILRELDAAGTRYEEAPHVRRAVQSVLLGQAAETHIDYRVERDHEEICLNLRTLRVDDAEGCIVISISEKTKRRLADQNAERRLQENAHSSRAAALGELAASIAHELNQPMTAILSNAQAARTFLAAGGAGDLDEVSHALEDIVSDDKRAGEIIQRMRTLLKKDAITRAVFDLNECASAVAHLAASAALLRRVSIKLDLAPQLPAVKGDFVQLQQVVLNLVVNAIEAASAQTAERRVVHLETEVRDGETFIHVRDRGPGIPRDHATRIFDPFFTTKPDGLGMGLAISRSIVESHGGRIWVDSSPDGSTFHVALPPFVEHADYATADRRGLDRGETADPIQVNPPSPPVIRPQPARAVLNLVSGSRKDRRPAGGHGRLT